MIGRGAVGAMEQKAMNERGDLLDGEICGGTAVRTTNEQALGVRAALKHLDRYSDKATGSQGGGVSAGRKLSANQGGSATAAYTTHRFPLRTLFAALCRRAVLRADSYVIPRIFCTA